MSKDPGYSDSSADVAGSKLRACEEELEALREERENYRCLFIKFYVPDVECRELKYRCDYRFIDDGRCPCEHAELPR